MLLSPGMRMRSTVYLMCQLILVSNSFYYSTGFHGVIKEEIVVWSIFVRYNFDDFLS